jgi:hypothetical protein
MRDQEIIGLWEAYQQVHSQPQELTEEVEIAAQYFYEMGLNEDGVDILIEELGVEEFAEFVSDIAEEYVLTEARAGGAKIEPKLASGKEIQGKPKAASLKRLRAQKEARRESEAKASEAKPSGLKASLKRQSAVVSAKKQQPKKEGILSKIGSAVSKGIERHNAANKSLNKIASETGKTLRKVGKAAATVAGEVASGASGTARLAGHVASKGLKEEVEEWVNALVEEGYDLSEYTWEDMVEFYLDEGMTMKVFKQQRSRQKQKDKRAADKIAPNRRKDIHTDRLSPERAARHRANVDPDFEGNDERNYPGGRLRPNKIRKAKALGELGEGVDLFDVILEHLVAEGYAETNEAALAIMANMSEEWKQSIVEEVFDEALTGERYKKAVKKPGGTAYSRMVSADPSKRATRGGRGGESDFGAGDRGSGNKASRRAGTYKED